MASPKSFESTLRYWCGVIKPKMILEWGPGFSTQVLREECPKADIYSLEDKKKYYNIAKQTLKNMNIKIFLYEDRDIYTNPPLVGKFDLIFVDGRDRVECMTWAKEHLSRNGVLILHDAERKKYMKGIEQFGMLSYLGGTICLGLRY